MVRITRRHLDSRRLVKRGLIAAGLLTLAGSGPRQLTWLPGSPVTAAVAQQGQALDVDWRMLAGLDYKSGEMTDQLKAVNGKMVRVPGFMVPLEDEATGVTEFLLVPWVGACIHTPPPPPNQIVYVPMANGRKVKVEWWDPIWVHGRLEVTKTESLYGEVGFRLVGTRVEAYDYDKS